MMIVSLWAYIAISVFIIVMPGPDTALTIRNAILGGKSAGLATALGVSSGLTIWALATGLGLVAVLLASEMVFHAIKLAGAAYLLWLGVNSLIRAIRDPGAAAALSSAPKSELQSGRAFRQGLFSNLSNPKIAVFFASILPQFAPSGDGMLASVMTLGILFSAMTFVWLALYVAVITLVSGVLQRSWVRRTLDGFTGAALVLFGLKLAATER